MVLIPSRTLHRVESRCHFLLFLRGLSLLLSFLAPYIRVFPGTTIFHRLVIPKAMESNNNCQQGSSCSPSAFVLASESIHLFSASEQTSEMNKRVTLSATELMKAPPRVLSSMQSPQDRNERQRVDEVHNALYRRSVKMWTKRKPYRLLVIAIDESVAKLEAEVLLNCDRCFAISSISRVLVSAFDTFEAGGGDLRKIYIDIAQDTGLVPVLARICSIYLDSTDHHCFACLLDLRVLVRMIDPIVSRFWPSDSKWRLMLGSPPSTGMLISQFLSYVSDLNDTFDLFPGCVCYFFDENRTVLTEYGFLGTAVETAVEAFDVEMALEKPNCSCIAEIADSLRGNFVRYLRDGGTLNETDRRLVEETRLLRMLSRICLSDELNTHDDRGGCSSCCYRFHLLVAMLHSIFVSYWGSKDDCKNSHWSSGSDTKTLVIFLSGFCHVDEKDFSELSCKQLDGKLLIPIVEGNKVVSLEYQSSETKPKLNIDCEADVLQELAELLPKEDDDGHKDNSLACESLDLQKRLNIARDTSSPLLLEQEVFEKVVS